MRTFSLEDGSTDLRGKGIIPLWERTYGGHVLLDSEALKACGRSSGAVKISLVQVGEAAL